MKNTGDIRNFYNDFSLRQVRIGTNLRHYTIFNALVKAGLKPRHKVLEIGCGIGALTKLLHGYLRKGKIVATDISDKGIEVAQKNFPNSRIVEFYVTDMRNFIYPDKFDFILLPDVLEHIPIDDHDNLFRLLSGLMHNSSRLIIHIPHPQQIEFLSKEDPEKLQVIDQAIHADVFCAKAYMHNLILESYDAYPLFSLEPDYVFIKMKLNAPVRFTPLSKSRIIKKKLGARIKRIMYTAFS